MENADDFKIPANERTPIVLRLLSVIETLQGQLLNQHQQLAQQLEQLALQSQKIDLLLEEIRRLKKLSGKPKLSASKLPKEPNDKDDDNNALGGTDGSKRAGSSKRSKNKDLKIDKEEIISVENIPAGSIHKGYQDYIVQDLIIKPQVIKYRLERWQLPDGRYIIAELPNALKGHHFGPTLRAYIMHQYYHQRYPITFKRMIRVQGIFADKWYWEEHLERLQITNPHYRRLVTEAALIGSLLRHGFPKDMVILSDDTGQFNVFLHALCWIHAERGIKSLIPGNTSQQEAVDWARNEIWEIYHALLAYKNAPDETAKTAIEKRFNDFCHKKTHYQLLNRVLQRLYKNKMELLLVLERPEIPLHNNLSERDIRDYVKRRKISGSTRSDEGRRCRDTFTSLKM